jgi:hypothetical protein
MESHEFMELWPRADHACGKPQGRELIQYCSGIALVLRW